MFPAPLAILLSDGLTGLLAMVFLAAAVWLVTKVVQLAVLATFVVLVAYLLTGLHPLAGT